MMKKRTPMSLWLLCLLANPLWAQNKVKTNPPKVWTEAQVAELKSQWHTQSQMQFEAEEKKLTRDRENFLHLEALLNSASRQKRITPEVVRLAQGMLATLTDYPLFEEANWALVKAQLANNQLDETALSAFIQQYPKTAKRNQLDQRPFEWLSQQQRWGELVDYANKIAPVSVENQCRVLGARYQLLAEKLNLNPEAEQAEKQAEAQTTDSPTAGQVAPAQTPELTALLNDFDILWLSPNSYWKNAETLPESCDNLASYWRDQGGKTAEKIATKAVNLVELGAKKALEKLARDDQNPELASWLNTLVTLVKTPAKWKAFAEEQPVNANNKRILLSTFSAYLRTIPEALEDPSFAPFQAWATKWGLNAEEQTQWKVRVIQRLFDNPNSDFQVWRDDEIRQLKVDTLTERRLRLAIHQQQDLTPWLALLSEEGRTKAEWRYWAAKNDPVKGKAELQSLSQERGFYPMLAAQQLGITYQVAIPESPQLSPEQTAKVQSELARIRELRTLKRFALAKSLWAGLLNDYEPREKLALSGIALANDWFDLAVEGTIQAKGWDYIPLRLPNAYHQWFQLHLANKAISQSFAMAIARQESAWNAEAKSHANAIGLMQMLPSTAKETAENQGLPFSGEGDLLDPFHNIMLGTTHLAELNDKFPHNRILISASYNAGANRVTQWLARSGGKLALDEFIASIPFRETRGYVQNVLSYDYYYQLLQKQPNPIMFSSQELGKY
ncbi:hypothetical protein A4G19_15255 [Pasteurellaceae bacterium Macca]|nr:hypothetical protein [Pasteurellaceae bacterium Macca]